MAAMKKKSTGRSADASAGAADVKKKIAAKKKQNITQASDVASRRFQTSTGLRGGDVVRDKLTGVTRTKQVYAGTKKYPKTDKNGINTRYDVSDPKTAKSLKGKSLRKTFGK